SRTYHVTALPTSSFVLVHQLCRPAVVTFLCLPSSNWLEGRLGVSGQPSVPAVALLERAKAGDKDAFGELAEEHRAALQRLCFKMTGSQEEAEDLVQETLLKAYTHIADFQLRASLSTWLFRIATNACLDHQRARK